MPSTENAEFGTGVYPRASIPGPLFTQPASTKQLYRVTALIYTEKDPSELRLADLVEDALDGANPYVILGYYQTCQLPEKHLPQDVAAYFFKADSRG